MLKRGVPRKSCDLCRKRKVRCDRGETDALQQCCSYCKLRGVVCLLSTASGGSARTVPGQQEQVHQLVLQQDSSSTSSQTNALFQASTIDLSHPPVSFNLEDVFPELAADQSLYTFAHPTINSFDFPDSLTAESSGSYSAQCAFIFDVTDLTQDILDESIASYFTQVSHTLPLLDPIKYYTQYSSLVIRSTNSLYSAKIATSTHLLTLAIALKGIGYTAVPERFQLQETMMSRFMSVFTKDSDPLQEGGLAVLQSLILVSDLVMTESMEQAWLESRENPLQLHPLSHEALVSLAFHYLRRREQECKKGGSKQGDDDGYAVEEATALRIIFILDAFHSRGECFPQIRDEQAELFLTATDDTDVAQDDADRLYFESLTSLSVLARILQRSLCSPKCIKNGVQGRDVLKQTQQVLLWYSNLPEESKWEPKNDRSHPPPTIRAAIIRCLWLFQLMAIESAVSEYGLSGDIMEKTEAAQLVSSQTRTAVLQVVEVAQACTSLGYYDQSVAVMRNLAAGCLQWSISQLAKFACSSSPSTDQGSRSPSSSSEYFTSKEEIVPIIAILFAAVESVTSHADTATVCMRLKEGFETVMTSL